MATKSEDLILEELRKAMAAKVVIDMGGPARDAILTDAVAKVIGGYEFKVVLEKAIMERGLKVAEDDLKTGKYDEQLVKAWTDGFAKILAPLAGAFAMTLLEALTGRDGDSYVRGPAVLRRHLEQAMKDEKKG